MHMTEGTGIINYIRKARFLTALVCIALTLAACSNASPVSAQKSIAGTTIIIDAGHGNTDVGTIGATTGRYEKDVNLQIALKLQTALEEKGVHVVMTRENDQQLGEPLEDTLEANKEADMLKREEIIEAAGADLLISIHQNSFDDPAVRGPQMFYLKYPDTGEEVGVQLAETLQATLNDKLKIDTPRSISHGNWRLLKKGGQPGCIVECGFFSNPEEEALLQTESYQLSFVEALVEGIEAYVKKYGV